MGYTPLTDAVSAAAALAPIFSASTTTQFLSPAVAFTNSDWLKTFAAHCNNCMDKIPIISAHVYAADPAAALSQVETLHASWPSKRIWITELAPASDNSQGCNLDENGVINWMQTVVPRLVGLGYVDRIFWNTGEHVSFSVQCYCERKTRVLIFSIELHESLQSESDQLRRDGNESAQGIWKHMRLREVRVWDTTSGTLIGRSFEHMTSLILSLLPATRLFRLAVRVRADLFFMTFISVGFVARTHPPVTLSSRFNYISAIFPYNYN